MPIKNHKMAICQICKSEKKLGDVMPPSMVHGVIAEKIRKACPDWTSASFICITDLNRFRNEYLTEIIKQDKGELTEIESDVLKSLHEQELLSTNLNAAYDSQLTLGQRLADKIADFGGSWRFISIFAAVLFLWVTVNTTFFLKKPFDPYPYIFLNLVLSCLAAIQAPVIMMSQNRQEEKDRLRGEYDYKVNLKAELEIRHLHEKIDHLLNSQWQRLLEIQEMQTQLMEEIAEKRTPTK
ncbi:MAG TPA: DUF1003 domain-containing protein [Candidatus Sulfobium mesophilum]|nr:DUF1003 domain-containing protein [Candidatus Sulfobium mesophilum]